MLDVNADEIADHKDDVIDGDKVPAKNKINLLRVLAFVICLSM